MTQGIGEFVFISLFHITKVSSILKTWQDRVLKGIIGISETYTLSFVATIISVHSNIVITKHVVHVIGNVLLPFKHVVNCLACC